MLINDFDDNNNLVVESHYDSGRHTGIHISLNEKGTFNSTPLDQIATLEISILAIVSAMAGNK